MKEITNRDLFGQELGKAENNKAILEIKDKDGNTFAGQISGYAGSYKNSKGEMTKPAVAIMTEEGLRRFELDEIEQINIEEN